MIQTQSTAPAANGLATSGPLTARPVKNGRAMSEQLNEPPRAAQQAPPSAKTPRRRFAPRTLAVAATLAVAVSAAVIYAASRAASGGAAVIERARALPVDVTTVDVVDSYNVSRSYSGEVVARRKSRVGFELSGMLARIDADEGATVERGEPLAVLDTEQLKTQRRGLVAQARAARALLDELVAGPRREDVDAARATVRSLNAEVELLRLQTARAARLLARNAISQDEYDVTSHTHEARQAELATAGHQLDELLNGTRKEKIDAQRAVVEQAAAAVAAVDVDLRKSVLRAPYSGTVSERFVDEGTVVEAGMPIIELVENSKLEAWIGVPPQMASTLAIGSRHEIAIENITVSATVDGVVPAIDPATQTRTVIFALDEQSGSQIVDGQIARIELSNTVQERGSWIPASAIQRDTRGLWVGYALSSPSAKDQLATAADASTFQLTRQYLEVLHMQADQVFVRGTLSDGQRIVRDGVHRLVAGQLVRVAD